MFHLEWGWKGISLPYISDLNKRRLNDHNTKRMVLSCKLDYIYEKLNRAKMQFWQYYGGSYVHLSVNVFIKCFHLTHFEIVRLKRSTFAGRFNFWKCFKYLMLNTYYNVHEIFVWDKSKHPFPRCSCIDLTIVLKSYYSGLAFDASSAPPGHHLW